ncbi:MAG: co-chaperone YbbN, partial [Gammaproteobacteria bacterium]|nr:co-chaperone YbbN [Gammaproteobacteria bacterium]
MQPNSHSFNVSAQTFQSDVVVKSKEVPVVILLWAQQIEPSVEMKMLCERVVETYQGKLVLATSDV